MEAPALRRVGLLCLCLLWWAWGADDKSQGPFSGVSAARSLPSELSSAALPLRSIGLPLPRDCEDGWEDAATEVELADHRVGFALPLGGAPWGVVYYACLQVSRHINALELRGLILLVKDMVRRSSRILTGLDSRVALGAAEKGRSSSTTLNFHLCRPVVFCVTYELTLVLFWVWLRFLKWGFGLQCRSGSPGVLGQYRDRRPSDHTVLGLFVSRLVLWGGGRCSALSLIFWDLRLECSIADVPVHLLVELGSQLWKDENLMELAIAADLYERRYDMLVAQGEGCWSRRLFSSRPVLCSRCPVEGVRPPRTLASVRILPEVVNAFVPRLEKEGRLVESWRRLVELVRAGDVEVHQGLEGARRVLQGCWLSWGALTWWESRGPWGTSLAGSFATSSCRRC